MTTEDSFVCLVNSEITLPVSIAGTVSVTTAVPMSSNLLVGAASTDGATIVTIPAGKTFTFAAQSAQINGSAVASITFEGGGTGAIPAAGTTILAGHASLNGLRVVAGSAAATLRFHLSGLLAAGAGIANGVIT